MRVTGWKQVLDERVEHWRTAPHVYGTTDCCQFCADIVLALVGVDYRMAFPIYASREEAEQVIAAEGGMIQMLTSVMGPAKHVSQAMKGDLLAVDFGDGIAPAICLGLNCCTLGPAGLVFVQTRRAVAAWTV